MDRSLEAEGFIKKRKRGVSRALAVQETQEGEARNRKEDRNDSIAVSFPGQTSLSFSSWALVGSDHSFERCSLMAWWSCFCPSRGTCPLSPILIWVLAMSPSGPGELMTS